MDDPTRPIDPEMSIERMDPRFCYRLGRLLQACMDAGYDVKMVEGYRTVERQKHLYAIGRTIDQAKPVVTDTKHSLHLVGRAMDVCSPTLGYTAPALFDWLRLHAATFGLRTLPGDRGHIEEVE
jgi:LAS superfamily LD-carboxypeptidase LdcB